MGKGAVKNFRRAILFLLTLLLIFPNMPAAAISDSLLKFFNSNGIYYYNPSNSTTTCLSGVSISSGTAEEKVWSGLKSLGFSDVQAAAAMGNIANEGGWNPVLHEQIFVELYLNGTISEDQFLHYYTKDYKTKEVTLLNGTKSVFSYGIGIVQWSFERRVELLDIVQKNYPDLLKYFLDAETYGSNYLSGDEAAQKMGEAVFDEILGIELEFINYELTEKDSVATKNLHLSEFFEKGTIEEATHFWLYEYENPANKESAYEIRLTYAEKYYELYAGKVFSGGSCSDAETFQEYVLAYAWPEYHAPEYLERTDAYASIVAERILEGKYVGGSVGGVAGIDCGGFVTTLMQESGFAAEYNNGGGDTTFQERWVKENGWTLLNGSEYSYIDTSILQPGDVAFRDGHTFVYVGEIDGFDSNIASASYSEKGNGRAPMAGKESLTIYHEDGRDYPVRWYRKTSGSTATTTDEAENEVED